MPLLTTVHGFHPWYIEELPLVLQEKAKTLLEQQNTAVTALHTSPEIAQYYTAMGYNIANRLTGDLHALTYLAELRSTQFVHPTLRKRAQEIGNILKEVGEPYGIQLFIDHSIDRFDSKRGEHDIIQKR